MASRRASFVRTLRRRGAVGGVAAALLAASGAASGQHAEPEDGNPTAEDQGDQPGPEPETEAGPGPATTPEPAGRLPTALQALAIALPRLRQVHPRGMVMD